MVLLTLLAGNAQQHSGRADDNAVERSRVDPAGVCQPTRSTRLLVAP
jgi:hypothetical protein